MALEKIQMKVTPQNFSAWFKNTELASVDKGIATISCPSNFAREWLDSNHHQLIKNLLEEITKSKLDIVFEIDGSNGEKEEKRYENTISNPNEAPIFNVQYTHENLVNDARIKANITSIYTFEAFIVGSCNKLAHAAAEAVADNLGRAYNPLFIYGGVGLGKTHLMHSIANRVLERDPNKKILYCPSESFLNDMVESIRKDSTTEFRNTYRKLDLLMIDDIQFISNWDMAQTEIFHTFNTLYQAGKQIILASDRPPKEIDKLTDRLRSRFEGGMVADISAPDYETRVAIIKQKADDKGIYLPEYILDFVAREFDNNIRELEGALVKVGTHVKIGGTIPTQEEVAVMLQIDAASKRRKTSPRDIIRSVSKVFGISVKELRSKKRNAEIVTPRHICMYLMRKELDLPLERIARELNRNDHTTVLNAIERIEEKIEEDDILKRKMESIEL
ncbi:MAG: chromosomal replication initiator protein DnaA [bacterium]